jgi:hypothetical protein
MRVVQTERTGDRPMRLDVHADEVTAVVLEILSLVGFWEAISLCADQSCRPRG